MSLGGTPVTDGVPPGQYGGYPPIQDWMEYPPPPTQDSEACTYYAAGGMPLAFTQEDCRVLKLIWE